MNKEIKDLIARYEDKGFFTRIAPTEEMLADVRQGLGLSVPDQYLEYLNTYSHGGIGFEINGIGFDGSISFLEETLEYREDGLPNNLIVVENCDEWLYCIDANTGEIVSWAIDEDVRVEYPSFDDFLIDRLNDAAENL